MTMIREPVSHPHPYWRNVGTIAFWTLWVLLMLVSFGYFLPWFVGWRRHVPNLGSVAVVNVLAGWTMIGYVVAFAMACRTVPPALPAGAVNIAIASAQPPERGRGEGA